MIVMIMKYACMGRVLTRANACPSIEDEDTQLWTWLVRQSHEHDEALRFEFKLDDVPIMNTHHLDQCTYGCDTSPLVLNMIVS